jgi:hypothetical protein
MAGFVPGLRLSRLLYEQAVRPLLAARFPGLPHGAALLGRGSEVLGYDDETSTDHDWAPRVLLFLEPDDHERWGARVAEALAPLRFDGRATDCPVLTVRGFVLDQLGLDLDQDIEAPDWLTLPEHRLCTVTAGAVHHDDVGLLLARDRLAYYPRDVWVYLMVAAWWRVHPEANLVGRAGAVGDELGSAVLTAELVHGLMRLAFLMERRYAPYAKWFGTAFARLPCAATLSPALSGALTARSWQEREAALVAAYRHLADRHHALGITRRVETGPVRLWDRPFTVLWGDFPEALAAEIQDPAVRRIAQRWPVGGVDRLRDLLWDPGERATLARLLG